MKNVADTVLGLLTAKSPRVVCTKCGEGFLVASIKVRISKTGFKDCCPRCGEEGPFRGPSAEEAAAIAPERFHWWFLGPIGVLILVVLGATLWRGLK
jgi:hypothetical protein